MFRPSANHMAPHSHTPFPHGVPTFNPTPILPLSRSAEPCHFPPILGPTFLTRCLLGAKPCVAIGVCICCGAWYVSSFSIQLMSSRCRHLHNDADWCPSMAFSWQILKQVFVELTTLLYNVTHSNVVEWLFAACQYHILVSLALTCFLHVFTDVWCWLQNRIRFLVQNSCQHWSTCAISLLFMQMHTILAVHNGWNLWQKMFYIFLCL